MSSLFHLGLVFFAPESPRRLVYKNRREEAKAVQVEYHGMGNEDSELVRFELTQIDHALELENAQSVTSWKEWFRTPANRYRLFIITTLGFIIQWCGNALISYYLHLVLNSVGITGTKTQLLINGGITINVFFWGNFWFMFYDRVGRRPVFLIGMSGMFCAFLVLTVLTGIIQGQHFSSDTMGRATVAMIFISGIFYKLPAPMVDSHIAEVSPYELRAKAFVILQFGDAGANLFSGYVNPIALAAIEWKYYIVWCCVLISNFLIISSFYPETKKLSLEEVGQMFDGAEKKQKMVDEEEVEGNEKLRNEFVEETRSGE